VTPSRLARTVVLGVLAALGAVAGARTHMLWMSGRKDLTGVKGCWTCHFISTSRLAWSKKRPHHAAPAGLVPSPDGARLYVALDDTDEIAVADVASRRVIAKAHVAGAPTGIAVGADGEKLFITCRGGDRLAVLQARTLAETGSIPVGVGPVGVARLATPAGERLVVANAVSDDLSVVSVSPLAEVARLAAGREPYAVASGPGSRALVVSRMAGLARGDEVPASEVTVVDAASARVSLRARLESAHLSEGIALVPRRPWALASIIKVRNLVPITQVAQGWVMSSGLAVCDPETGKTVEIPLDEANAYLADPSGVAVDTEGRRAYVASGGGDVVSVVDLDRLGRWLDGADETARKDAIDDLQLSPEYVLARIPTGRNPRQVALSPDGKTLFVAERLDDSILLVDTESLRPVGRIALGDGGEQDPIRRGERVFARARTTFQAQFSCRSCHPDGHVDGLTYDFDIDGVGRDIVDNRSLQGLDGTAPFKWNGRNPSLKVQCGPRFAKVLTRAAPFAEKDLDDLDAFLTSLPPTRTGHETHGHLTEAQERGRRIFFATRTTDGREIPYSARCSTCHRPPLYTDRLPADVDTMGPFDNTGKFDVPHLLGIAASAPYLHDGRAATLEEIWTVYNPKDTHGITNYMTKHQLNDLIEFLKTL
jgi:YVTN family beta-propeller protein